MLPKMTFVLGGAASRKSLWAENLLLGSDLSPVYLATPLEIDDEIKLKINLHKKRRNRDWMNIDAEKDLEKPPTSLPPEQAILIGCATMWLASQMMDDDDLDQAKPALFSALTNCAAPVVSVSNEIGHGSVPDNALARRFREAQGRLNIALAERANLVVFVTASLPQVHKGHTP
ncbi:MAG: bifunctional adenosylcobinamide kinase/adenosylcobinamide-phosphate guanylyltransferase [Roseobacter sp.]